MVDEANVAAPETTAKQTCGGCMFYKPAGVVGAGECRRFPAQVVLVPKPSSMLQGQVDLTAQSLFPSMQPIGWCGEWNDGKGED